MTTVVVPGALRQYCDGASKLELALDDGATLADIFESLEQRHPLLVRRICDEQGVLRRYVNLYIDGVDARELGSMAAPIASMSEVLVLPSIAGG